MSEYNNAPQYMYDLKSNWDYDYYKEEEDIEQEVKNAAESYMTKLKIIGILLLVLVCFVIWLCCPCFKIAIKSGIKAMKTAGPFAAIKPLVKKGNLISRLKDVKMLKFYFLLAKVLLLIVFAILLPIWFPILLGYIGYILLWSFFHGSKFDLAYYGVVREAKAERLEPPSYEEFLRLKRTKPKVVREYNLLNEIRRKFLKFWPFEVEQNSKKKKRKKAHKLRNLI